MGGGKDRGRRIPSRDGWGWKREQEGGDPISLPWRVLEIPTPLACCVRAACSNLAIRGNDRRRSILSFRKKETKKKEDLMEEGSARGTIILSRGWTESHRGKDLSSGLEDHFRDAGFRVSRSESMLPDFILSYAGAGSKRFSSAVIVIREEGREIMSDQEEQIVRKMASTFQSAYVLVEGRMKGNKLFHHATRSLCGRPPVISFVEGKELCALLDSFVMSSKLLPRLQPELERSAIAGCQETILESMRALPGVNNMQHAKLLARAFGSIANFTIQCKKIRPTLMPGSEIHGKQDLEVLSKICQECSVALWNCEGRIT